MSSLNDTTVLYLAYGSNLCAETFLVRRGIKPLSQVNVYVPDLEFNLSLRGMPYLEPCFANVAYRKEGNPPVIPADTKYEPVNPWRYSDEKWDGGLMGVVYEVTHEDYRQIIRTEGGGSGYQEIEIPCIPLLRGSSTAHMTDNASPEPIFAKTLYEPPDASSRAANRPWIDRFLVRGQRPDPDYAQASARYLKLIKDGAREHQLPAVYQQYLASLQPYTVTTLRQQIGRVVCAIVIGPVVLLLLAIAERLADENGKYPKWIAAIIQSFFNIVWSTYDHVWKPLFGDGERTQSKDESIGPIPRSSLLRAPHIIDEAKLPLLRE